MGYNGTIICTKVSRARPHWVGDRAKDKNGRWWSVIGQTYDHRTKKVRSYMWAPVDELERNIFTIELPQEGEVMVSTGNIRV